MIHMIDLNELQPVLEFLTLQQRAYRIEAELMGFESIPPLFDSPKTLKESHESFFGYYLEDRLVGAIACRCSGKELLICRLMVHPDYFRRGIASSLIEHVEELAAPGMKIKVATGTGNVPAMEFYLKHGFEPIQNQLIAPGITLTQFIKIR